MPKTGIRIVNPVPNGARSLGLEHAQRYVRSGRAQWADSSTIRFTESDYRYRTAVETAKQTGWNYDRADQVRRLDEIRNIPVLFPSRLR